MIYIFAILNIVLLICVMSQNKNISDLMEFMNTQIKNTEKFIVSEDGRWAIKSSGMSPPVRIPND